MFDTETKDLVTVHTDGNEQLSVMRYSPGEYSPGERRPFPRRGVPTSSGVLRGRLYQKFHTPLGVEQKLYVPTPAGI